MEAMSRSSRSKVRSQALWSAWGFAAAEAEFALDAWLKAADHLKAAAYAAYREALDLEELTAADLAAVVAPEVGQRLQVRLAVNHSPA
jgi:hypothetical protein